MKVGDRVRLRREAVPDGFLGSREGVVAEVVPARGGCFVRHVVGHRWDGVGAELWGPETVLFGWSFRELEAVDPIETANREET